MKTQVFNENLSLCYKKYSSAIVKFLHRYIKYNRDICEEIMQETFLRILEKEKELDPFLESTKNYLFSIAKNIAFDYLRKAHADYINYNKYLIKDVNFNEQLFRDLEDIVIDGEVISTLHGTIDSFPQEKRAAFVKRFFFNKKKTDIVNELKISEYLLNRILNEIIYEIKCRLKKIYFIS